MQPDKEILRRLIVKHKGNFNKIHSTLQDKGIGVCRRLGHPEATLEQIAEELGYPYKLVKAVQKGAKRRP